MSPERSPPLSQARPQTCMNDSILPSPQGPFNPTFRRASNRLCDSRVRAHSSTGRRVGCPLMVTSVRVSSGRRLRADAQGRVRVAQLRSSSHDARGRASWSRREARPPRRSTTSSDLRVIGFGRQAGPLFDPALAEAQRERPAPPVAAPPPGPLYSLVPGGSAFLRRDGRVV